MAVRVLIEASVLGTVLVMMVVHSPGTTQNKTGARLNWSYPSFADALQSHDMLFFRDVLLGTVWCAAAATFSCILLIDSPFKPETPLLFLPVLLAVSSRFGAAAGSIGTGMAALIFAEFLFEPIHKLAVNSPVARSDLGWMILGGLAISTLFGKPRRPVETRHHHHGGPST